MSSFQPETRTDLILIPPTNIHENLSFLIFWAQLFATFPIHGLWEKDIRKIKFKLMSLRTLFALFNLSCGVIMGLFCCYDFFYRGIYLFKLGKD